MGCAQRCPASDDLASVEGRLGPHACYVGGAATADGAMIPGRGRVLLRRVESGESYPGGKIIIPETVRDALMAQHAEVVAVGEPALCEHFDTCPRPAEVHGSVPDLKNPTSARA